MLGQFAHGEYLVTLSNFQTSTPISAALNLTEDSAGVSLQIATPPTLSGTATVSMALTFGFDTGTSTGATPGFFIQPASITEGVSLAATGFTTTATLGVADATVTGGAASISATATVLLQDPIFGDTNSYITPTELADAPLASLVSTSLTGAGSVSLPISSSLVLGGPQTLQLNWSGNLAAVGGSNLASLGAWAQLDTISPSLLRQAVAALPGIIQAASGSEGFGAAVPVLGSGLGQLFDFGTQFADAAAATASATSLSQVASALQTNLGGTVTFTVNTADNELDMLITVSNAFDTTIPYSIDTPVDGNTLMLSGNLTAAGTATATLDLGLSFDTSQPDASRLALIANNSSLSLAFDAVTATPIVTAALGLIRASVDNGSIAVGAQSSSGADPTQPATATITFNATSGGRITLAQLAANFIGSIGAPVLTGAVQATLPLEGVDGASTANLGLTWSLDQQAGSDPQMTGAAQAASLAVTLSDLATDPTLNAQTVAGLQTLVPWAAAVTTAATQTGDLAVEMPLVNQTLAELSGLAPATAGTFPGVLNVIASAINSFAVVGASTANFQSAIESALAAFTAANPAYTFPTISASAGDIPASDTSAATALGLTPGVDQLVFTLNVVADYASTPTISLTPSTADDNIGMSTAGTATGAVTLALTFAVQQIPTASAQDDTFVILNGLTAAASAAVVAPFQIGIGVLGATVSKGGAGLDTSAVITMVSDGTGLPQAYSIGTILGTAAADLVNVTEQQPSTVSAELTLTSTFGDLSGGLATLVIAGDPLSNTAPTFSFTGGYQATDFQSFANLAPTDILGALSTLASAMDDLGGSPALSVDVPLTDVTVGQAADFGTIFNTDVVDGLSSNSSHTPIFDSIQTFQTDLAALTGVTGTTVTYDAESDQMEIAFTLSEGFPATPASFTYDLTGTSGTTLGNLTDVTSTSATATLSISGTGSAAVAFDFALAPNSVQVKGVAPVPTNGVLITGSDAHFTLNLSAPGDAAATLVPVTVAAASTQSNTTATQLLANINTALQTALTGAGLAANLVTATLSSSNNLVLTMVPGVFTDLAVTAAPDDPAVYELGLAPPVTPTASITGNTALPSNGQLTADATFTVTADGGTATPVTITAASTASNSNRSQLVTEVNSALAALNATLKAANRSPITASLTSTNLLSISISDYGSTLSIADTNTSAQTGLGLPPSASIEPGAPDVYVEASAGPVPSNGVLTEDTTFAITVDGLPTVDVTVTAASTANNDAPVPTGITDPTPAQLLAEEGIQTPLQLLTNEINQALAPVNTELADAGLSQVTTSIGSASSNADLDAGETSSNSDQVLFFSTLGNTASIVVQGATDNQLGIGPDDTSAAPMLMVTGGQSFLDNINVTQLTLNAALTVTGSVAATAQLGVVAIDLGPTDITLNPTVALTLESGNVPLATLTTNPTTTGDYFDTTLGGAASVTLPVAAADGLNAQLGLDANAALTLNATNMFTLSGWTANTSALESLTSLQDFSFADAQAAVTQFGSLVAASTASTSGLFGQLVPLINQPLGTAMGITQDFANLAADLQPGMNFTLDQLEGALNTAIGQAFGLPTTGSYATVQWSGSNLQLTLNFTPDLASTNVPLNFNLSSMGIAANSNLPGVKDFTGSNVTVTPSANFNLVLDIDLASPTSPIYELDFGDAVRPRPADRGPFQRHGVAGTLGVDLRGRHSGAERDR